MPYGLLADAVVALHAAFILFALLGGALLVRFPRILWLHAPALAWGSWIAASGNICPLTPLENRFRASAGEGEYAGGFIDQYLTPVIYPEGLTRGTQAAYGAVLVTVNLVFYWRWLHFRSQARRAAA
jgi:hypothetical protein